MFFKRLLKNPTVFCHHRWRAAHSVRCFAKLERWKIINALVAKFPTEDAHPFQAPELPFYYMHARLWLLIALARIALDNPKNVVNYHKFLIKIALNENSPHVLMKHFASRAILACVDSGNLKLSARREKQIRAINLSPFPRLKKKLKKGGYGSFYQSRPKDVPEPKSEFHLNYDFDRYDVHGLSDVFGKPGWEVKQLITEVVRGFDPDVKSMSETGGRKVNHRNSFEMTSMYHTYGQQLGLHSLFIVAGQLLQQYPITDDSYYDDPWTEWMNSNLLTRNDGLWLSDGIDRPPLEVKNNLLEKGKDGLVLTGSKTKILSLVGIDSALGQEIVVKGSWNSPDKIKVQISSALVAPRKAKALSRQLIEEEPSLVWIPTYDEYEHEHLIGDKKEYFPWIVSPSMEGRLDEYDPLGAICAERRPRFVENIIEDFSLATPDPFGRIWRNSDRKPVADSDAWGYKSEDEDESSDTGVRLVCSGQFLSDVLA